MNDIRKKAYLANQYGFNEIGRLLLKQIKYNLEFECEFNVLDPFQKCEEVLDINKLKTLTLANDVFAFWEEFNFKVPVINNKLMADSDCMIALLDGGHSLDDGVSSEIGYYAGRFPEKPIFALRTDFRLCENPVGKINVQVLGYITMSGQKLFTSLEEFYTAVGNFGAPQQ